MRVSRCPMSFWPSAAVNLSPAKGKLASSIFLMVSAISGATEDSACFGEVPVFAWSAAAKKKAGAAPRKLISSFIGRKPN